MKQIKVIILDDSMFMRESLQQELERDGSIKVVAKVATAYEARDKIVELLPDVLISDVYLTEMSGVDFVRKLLPQHYLPVIMISSDPTLHSVAKMVNAVDFIPKPASGGAEAASQFYRRVVLRIKSIMNGDEGPAETVKLGLDLIAIGASTGGTDAVDTILRELPPVMPPIVISQHMPKAFTAAFAARLDTRCALSVKEAEEGELLVPGQVYVAPGGDSMTVVRMKDKLAIAMTHTYTTLTPTPNIDSLFRSVAEAAPGRAAGVILTGMGKDGAKGLFAMKNASCKTIGQDEQSCIVYGMPKVAYEIGAVDTQLPLSLIARKLINLSR